MGAGGGRGELVVTGSVARGVAIGAVVGVVAGLLAGLVLHAVLGDEDLLVYEIVGGLFGAFVGLALGAFYGGALSLPRSRR